MQRRAVISSFLLHLALFLLAVFGLPSLFDKAKVEDTVMTVEILPISEMSNVKPRTIPTPPKEKPEIKKPEPPKVVKKPEPKKPEPKKPEVVKTEPPKPKPTPVKVEKPEPKPEPKVKPQVKKPEPKKPEPKPEVVKKPEPKKPEPKKEETTEDDFAALEKTLEKDVTPKQKEEKKEEAADPFENLEKELSSATSQKYNSNIPLSISEMDAVRQQFYSCWTPPVGARDLENMKATVRVKLEQDGTVTGVELVQTASSGSDSFARVFGESAVRAVWTCNPLKHTPPREKYGNWQEMELIFNPKDMY